MAQALVERQLDRELFEPIDDTTGGALDKFIGEYRKLQQALRKSHESENRFITKCRELRGNITASEAKLGSLDEAQESNWSDIQALKNTIAETQKKKAATAVDVDARKVKIKFLRGDLQKANQRLENASEELFAEQERTIGRLEKKMEDVSRQRDKERAALTTLRTDNIALSEQVRALEETRAAEEAELASLDARIDELNRTTSDEEMRRAELDALKREQQARVTGLTKQIKLAGKRRDEARQALSDAVQKRSEAEQRQTDKSDEFNAGEEKRIECDDMLIAQHEDNVQVDGMLREQQVDLDARSSQLHALEKEVQKKRRMCDALRKKVSSMDGDVARAEQDKIDWAEKFRARQEQMRVCQQLLNANTKQMDISVREREVLSQNNLQRVGNVASKEQRILIAESTAKSITNELKGYAGAVQHLHKIIKQLHHDKEMYNADLVRRQSKRASAEAEVASKALDINALQRKILDNEAKLRQQQNLLEAVRSDRNLYNKQLLEQKEEMLEYKRKFANLNHIISQVKMELAEKDNGFVTEHFNVERVDADVLGIRTKIQTVKARIGDWTQTAGNQAAQMTKLQAIIAEADQELQAQTKQFNAVVNEQRVMSQQLIERNEELARLYEDLRLKHSMFNKGESAYREKCGALRKVESARDELLLRYEELQTDEQQFSALQQMIRQMDDELVQEQLKARALTDELTKPINVHRWRQLMDTNTDTFSMLKRVQQLHKAIVQKADKISSKDGLIQQKEKLYVDLRRILARQPGSEARQQLRHYMQAILDKKAKLKVMRAELKLYQSKVYEYKYDCERLAKDLELIKLEWFSRKRRFKRRQHDDSQTSFSDVMRKQDPAFEPVEPAPDEPPHQEE